MKNILITTSTFDADQLGLGEELKVKGFNPILNPYQRKLTELEVKKLIEEFQPVALLAGTEPLNQNVLGSSRNLKVISRIGIGCENIHLPTAQKMGIHIEKTSEGLVASVAELTVGLMLDVLRKISLHDRQIRAGQWTKNMGLSLNGKRVGIIGFGQIGRYVGRLLKAFGCEVIAYDPAIGVKMVEDLVKMYSDLPSMLKHADIVTIHASVKDGECLLGKEQLVLLNKDAVVINTSRGCAVDEKALYDAITAGKIYGAGLDVFEQEPYTGKLKDLDNVVLTSHIGSYAREARQKMEASAVDNMLVCLKKLGEYS